MPAKWRAHRFHATTVLSSSSAVDDGAIPLVRYGQVTFLRLFPCEGRHAGVNGGSLLSASPLLTKEANDAERRASQFTKEPATE